MTKKIKIPLVPPLIVGLVVIFYFYLSYLDRPLTQAKAMFPLDKNHQYLIIPSDLLLNNGPLAYGIIKPGEATEAAALSWRRIGFSSVKIDDYVNRNVIIEGEWLTGRPLLLQQLSENIYGLLDEQPVIKIDNLSVVE